MNTTDDTDINGVTPGAGQCVVCTRTCPIGTLMCDEHWRQVPEKERSDLRAASLYWQQGAIDLGDLRLAQRLCVEATQ